jgi:hypothetical protein
MNGGNATRRLSISENFVRCWEQWSGNTFEVGLFYLEIPGCHSPPTRQHDDRSTDGRIATAEPCDKKCVASWQQKAKDSWPDVRARGMYMVAIQGSEHANIRLHGLYTSVGSISGLQFPVHTISIISVWRYCMRSHY